jgi:hypothetical protein
MAASTSKIPNLPTEIWLRILEFIAPDKISTTSAGGADDEDVDDLWVPGNDDEADVFDINEEVSRGADDLLFLWLDCRSVSHLFRSLVEYIFQMRYVKEIQIRFPRGSPAHIYYDHYRMRSILNLSFDSLAEDDPDIAIFKNSEKTVEDDAPTKDNDPKEIWKREMIEHFPDSKGDESTSKKRVGVPPWIIIWYVFACYRNVVLGLTDRGTAGTMTRTCQDLKSPTTQKPSR